MYNKTTVNCPLSWYKYNNPDLVEREFLCQRSLHFEPPSSSSKVTSFPPPSSFKKEQTFHFTNTPHIKAQLHQMSYILCDMNHISEQAHTTWQFLFRGRAFGDFWCTLRGCHGCLLNTGQFGCVTWPWRIKAAKENCCSGENQSRSRQQNLECSDCKGEELEQNSRRDYAFSVSNSPGHKSSWGFQSML